MTSFAECLGADLAFAVRSGIAQPPRKFARWLEEEIIIPDGPRKDDRFRFETQPITKLWAKEIDSERWVEHVFSGPSQSGKSFIGYVAPMLYYMLEHGENTVFAVPIEEMAADKYKLDILPILEASPKLRKLRPVAGSGSAGGTVRDRIEFGNQAIAKIMQKGGSDAAKAGFTSRILCVTEAAQFSDSTATSKEADPLRQLRARLQAHRRESRRIFIEGTKTVADQLPWTLRELSTKSVIYVPCPNCGTFVAPKRENLKGWQTARTEIEAAEKARWHCPACDEPFTEAERLAALQDARLVHDGQRVNKKGEISGEPPQTTRLWFNYGAFENALLSAADLAVECWMDAQIPEGSKEREDAEKAASQFRFGEIYIPPVIELPHEVEADDIAQRRLRLPRGMAPDDTVKIVIGADLGERVCHYVVVALRSTLSAHVADYGRFDVPLEQGTVEAALFKALSDWWDEISVGIPKTDGELLPIAGAFIDSNFQGDSVFRFIHKMVAEGRTSPNVIWPILGKGETVFGKMRYRQQRKTGNEIRKVDPAGRWHVQRLPRVRLNRLELDVDAFKTLVADAWSVPMGTPGSLTLFAGPDSIHRNFSRHQSSERLVEIVKPNGERKRAWEKTGANHYLDSVVYAICGGSLLGWDPAGEAFSRPAALNAAEAAKLGL